MARAGGAVLGFAGLAQRLPGTPRPRQLGCSLLFSLRVVGVRGALGGTSWILGLRFPLGGLRDKRPSSPRPLWAGQTQPGVWDPEPWPRSGSEGFGSPAEAQTLSPGTLLRLRGVRKIPEHPRNRERVLRRGQAGLGLSRLRLPSPRDAVSPAADGPVSRAVITHQGR